MSEPTKRKYPDTTNAELVGLYIARETLEGDTEKRNEHAKTVSAKVRGSYLSTIGRNNSRLREINARIEAIEKTEQKAAAAK